MPEDDNVPLPTFRMTLTAPDVGLRVDRRMKANHPVYRLVGRVVTEWAQLEHTLDLIIWEMAGLTYTMGSCITGQLSGHYPRFNAIQTLAKARGLSDFGPK